MLLSFISAVYRDPIAEGFTIFYILFGSSLVAAALAMFVETMQKDRDQWYTNELQERMYQVRVLQYNTNPFMQFYYFIEYHQLKFRPIFLWLAMILISSLVSWQLQKDWHFITALYFSVAALSTCGAVALNENSAHWEYFAVGLYCAIGVPVMVRFLCVL
jgi:hypothetical protein